MHGLSWTPSNTDVESEHTTREDPVAPTPLTFPKSLSAYGIYWSVFVACCKIMRIYISKYTHQHEHSCILVSALAWLFVLLLKYWYVLVSVLVVVYHCTSAAYDNLWPTTCLTRTTALAAMKCTAMTDCAGRVCCCKLSAAYNFRLDVQNREFLIESSSDP